MWAGLPASFCASSPHTATEPKRGLGHSAPRRSPNDRHQPPGPGFHLAFSAPDPHAVEEFYRAALRHGAKDNGAPGLRAHYGPRYFAAFVVDPDGHKLEAVFNGER